MPATTSSESEPPWNRHDEKFKLQRTSPRGDAGTLFSQITILAIIISSVLGGTTLYANSYRARSNSQALFVTFVLACMPLAKAIESEWALSDGATVIPDAYLDSKTASSILTAQAFKSYYESKNAPAPYSKEIMLDFLTSKTV